MHNKRGLPRGGHGNKESDESDGAGGWCTTLLTILVAVFASISGIFLYTTIPRQLGLFDWIASRYPSRTGMTPAFVPLGSNGTSYTSQLYEKLLEDHDLTGQRVIVTGASAGIGLAMATILATEPLLNHPEVVMACRNRTKCKLRADEIRQINPKAKVVPMVLDTSSFRSIQQFAKDFHRQFHNSNNTAAALDVLFLNAGTTFKTNKTHPCIPLSEPDGIEIVFQTNYLGHHLLYRLLEPALFNCKNPPATVVQTSSAGSFFTYPHKVATDLTTLNGCDPKSASWVHSYGQSKLAQVLWVQHLTQTNTKIIANAFHPGLVATEGFGKMKNVPRLLKHFVQKFVFKFSWNRTEGAYTGLYLGLAKQEIIQKGYAGKYFHPQAVLVNHPLVDEDGAHLPRKLWEFSDELVQEYL